MTVGDLPEELLAAVFAFLDRPSLLAAAATCHRWNRIASDDALWRSLYFLRYAPAGADAHASQAEDCPAVHEGGTEADDSGEALHAQSLASADPAAMLARLRFLHASPRSWRAADACRRAGDDALRALLAEREHEAELMRIQLRRAEEDIAALATCCEGLEAEQAMRLEAEVALRAARAELEDASYELMGRTHHLEEKTEEAARLARALVVAEKSREEEKHRADALEREAKALRERCEAAERSLQLSTQRWAKEKKKRKELLDLLAREQRSRSELTRETLSTMLRQLLAPASSASSSSSSSSSSSPSSSSNSRLPRSVPIQAMASSSPSSLSSSPSSMPPPSSSSILSASPPLPPSLAAALQSRRAMASTAGQPILKSQQPHGPSSSGSAAQNVPAASPPKSSSLYLPLKGQAKCNF